MKNLKLSIIFVGVLLGLSPAVLAADADGVGIIKGTITIGGKPATDAVVSIEGLSKEQVKAQPSLAKPQKRVMDQRNMKFIPTVVAIRVGETVDFPNNDKSLHNVYSKGGANDFDFGLYAPGKTRSKKFDNTGVSRILCNAHPNMEAFIVVKDHPVFSTTDPRGNYEIKNVPLGKVRVEIWYPNLEVRSESVEIVRVGEVFALNLDLKKR
jgi:plastocyanin